MKADAPGEPPFSFPHPIQVRSSSFVLAILYILITVVTLFQIGRILCYRHNLLHYQFFFLALCLVWSIIRAIFWIMNPWASFWENVLQFWAIWAQFAMFAFLVLFFVQVVYKSEGWWLAFRVRVFVIYSAIVAVFFFIYVAILVVSVEWGSGSSKTANIGAGFVSLMFLLLSASLLYYTYKMWYLKSSIKPQLPPNRSKVHILVITIILVFVFLSRTVKGILSIFGIGIIQFTLDMPLRLQIAVLIMYLAWEVVPLTLVILLFWNIPRTNRVLWGKFNSPYGNDSHFGYAYESDIRARNINDGSATDDTMVGWDGLGHTPYADIPHSSLLEEVDEASSPIILNTPGSFPGTYSSTGHTQTKLTPYNTKSPLLSSRR